MGIGYSSKKSKKWASMHENDAKKLLKAINVSKTSSKVAEVNIENSGGEKISITTEKGLKFYTIKDLG